MDIFYVVVLSVALAFLIILLTIIGILMQKKNVNNIYPPIQNKCPDYWDIYDTSYCQVPTSTSTNTGTIFSGTSLTDSFKTSTPGITTGAVNYIDFNNTNWSSTGKTSLCAQREWANKYQIVWDGVSNYNSC